MNGLQALRFTALFLMSTKVLADPFRLSYGGRLVKSDGAPFSGTVDLEVTFHDESSGGNTLGPVVTFDGVELKEGVFQISLTLDPADRQAIFGASEDVWIQVKDKTNGITHARQLFHAAPYALRVPVDGATLSWNADGELQVVSGALPYQDPSEKGQPRGYAELDAGGKVPVSQLPFTTMSFQGLWNAGDPFPGPACAGASNGHYYIVEVAGTTNVDGTSSWGLGDWVVCDSATWKKVANSTVSSVTSVNGQTGAINLTASDVSAIPSSDKGSANGVATLDASSKVPVAELPTMVGATGGAAGSAGLVPQPAAGDHTKFLSGAGTWETIDTTLIGAIPTSEKGANNGVATLGASGIVPTNQLPTMVGATGGASGSTGLVPAPAAGDDAKFLRGDGTWVDAPGTGIDGHSLDSADGSVVDAVYVRDDGNVGIGTAPTAEKVTVAGSVHSTTGGFKFPDGTSQTTAASRIDFILFEERATSTNNCTSGAWRTRALSNEVADTGNQASLASNQFTLQAGRYRCLFWGLAYQVEDHQTRLFNVTDNTAVALGIKGHSDQSDWTDSVSSGVAYLSISSAKTYRLEHYCEASGSFGQGPTWGGYNVASAVECLRLGD